MLNQEIDKYYLRILTEAEEALEKSYNKIFRVLTITKGYFTTPTPENTDRYNKSTEITISQNKNQCLIEDMTYNNIKITKRPDNRWFARKTINKKTYSIYGRTQLECLNNLKKFLKQPLKQIKENKNCIKLYEWLELWIKTYKEPYLKPKSLYEIQNCIKNHIKKHMENLPLNKITSMDIDIALNKIQSSRMKKYTFDCYVEAFRQAYKNKLIKEDVSSYINKVTHIRQKGRALTKEERQIFLEKTKLLKYGAIFEFQYYSGCRPQGARELKWEDIKEEQIFINETKSKNGQRYIPYFDNLKQLLKTIPHKSKKVFPISETTIKIEFEKLKELCGFDFTQKDLRHTFATICAENSINENTIAKWLGHGSPNTTRQYYIQILNDFEKEEITKLNKLGNF